MVLNDLITCLNVLICNDYHNRLLKFRLIGQFQCTLPLFVTELAEPGLVEHHLFTLSTNLESTGWTDVSSVEQETQWCATSDTHL